MNVVGFIDSSTKGFHENLPVLLADEFVAAKPKNAAVLIASQYRAEISANLDRLGFDNYFDAFPLAELALFEKAVEFRGFSDAVEVEHFYNDRYAGSYMDDWDEERKHLLAELFQSTGVPAGSRVLDFGCGSGALTALIKSQLPGCEVCGLDISDVAITKAARAYPDITFRTFGQINDARAELAGSFDVLFSHHVLEHVYDLAGTAREMAALVKPGGLILHILPCGNPGSLEHRVCTWYRDGVDAAQGGRFFFEDEGHLRRLTSGQAEQLFAPLGCRLERALFKNQLWGAIKWITECPPVFTRKLCDDSARDALHPYRLRLLRRFLLAVNHCRYPAGQRRTGYRAVVNNAVGWLAAREWKRHADKPSGSEMILLFRKQDHSDSGR